MLQVGCDIILELVTGIFSGCIAIGYIPGSWRRTLVSFIPKPGRRSYSTVKDFRRLSLTFFMLKMLERLVANYIRQTVLRGYALHRKQHAYTVSKSTETLHSVVIYIEKALDVKETVIGDFMDIEEAFNSTTRTTINNELSK